ncbi:MAG: LptF/LptG family permease [Cardiobacteriaceae bacterium]|nr:LptF/LptG family permease [Cardiobacteriaceae bacterium]
MTQMDRYLLKTLIKSVLGVLLVLLVLDLVAEGSSEASKTYGKSALLPFIQQLIHELPQKISLYLPAALLLGSLLGYGQHASHNELTLLQASGCSQWRIVRSGLGFALVAGFIALLIQEIAPKTPPHSASKALWLLDGETIVHIERQEDHTLHHVHLYQANPLTLTHIERATWQNNTWQLQNAYQSTLSQNERSSPKPITTWQSALTPEHIAKLGHPEYATRLREQHELIQLLKHYHQDSQREQLHYFQQLSYPLTTLTMLLLALPFAFGHSRLGGQGLRLLIGILLGLGYYLVQGVLTNLTLLLQWSVWVAVLFPNVLFASYPLWRLRQQ